MRESAINILLGTTILILLILLFRRLFWRKCNPNILYFLWIFVALRILLPLRIPIVLQDSFWQSKLINGNPVVSDSGILESFFQRILNRKTSD